MRLENVVLEEALEALCLVEENWEVAERYLDMGRDADEGLLEKVVFQDFSKLSDLERQACQDVCERVSWERIEVRERYTRFVAAVGGASICYVLAIRGELLWCSKWLTSEQMMACRTEMYARSANTLQQGNLSVLYSMGKAKPEVWYRGMELCRGKDDAAKMLMGAVYLYCLAIRKLDGEHREEVTAYLECRLLERMSELLQGTVPDADLQRIREFVLKAKEGDEIPEEIYQILRGKSSSEYLLTFLSGCAYLSLEERTSFGTFLRVMAIVDRESRRGRIVEVLRYMVDREWFYRHVDFLLGSLPVEKRLWIGWGIRSYEDSIWPCLAKVCPEEVKEAVGKLELRTYEMVLKRIKSGCPQLYQEISVLYERDYQQKAAEELVTDFEIWEDEARRYFLGELSTLEILPYVKDWRKTGSGYYGTKMERLENLREDPNHQQMYRRAVVMEGLLLHGTYFAHYLYDAELQADEIDKILTILQTEEMPMSYQLDTLSCIYESLYSYLTSEPQDSFARECVIVLERHIEEWGEDYRAAAVHGAAMTRIFCIRAMHLHVENEVYKETILFCAADSSKQVREVLLDIYVNHREWEASIKEMLTSKKQKARQMAVEVLKAWGVEAYRKELEQALEVEKNANLSEQLRLILGKENESDLEKIIANQLKGNRRQKIAWAWEQPYSAVHRTDGTEASEEYLQAIMACYAPMKEPGIHKDAVQLTDKLQKAELSVCMVELFDRWLNAGAQTKQKWALYAAAIHGGEAIIPLLQRQIKEWPAHARGAIAVEAVRALALNGSSTALLLVDQLSRKCKYRQVKKGAQEALAYAAAELGISQEELEDRIVPDLGFDAQMEQHFDYGARSFVVRLNTALELEVYGKDGKRLKNLPSPGKQDDPEKAKEANNAYKSLKKQLKTVTAAQKLRLECALMAGRFWQPDRWKALFVNNPLMHQFAIGLIWGVYEDGTLTKTFRYMEDGSLNTAEEEEMSFPEKGLIGLAHPVELSKEEREAWQEQFADYEITQPIEQLTRPLYTPEEAELTETACTRFQGTVVNGLSLSGKLIGQGWLRGPVEDGGEYALFYREDGVIRTELTFSGCSVVFENTNVVLYEIRFYRTNTPEKAICLLGEVAPRYFSEVLAQVAKAAPTSVCGTR